MRESCYRVRWHFSRGGGAPCYYLHADILAGSLTEALVACIDTRTNNWRQVDSFDSSIQAYSYFEYLYEVDPTAARKAARPDMHPRADFRGAPPWKFPAAGVSYLASERSCFISADGARKIAANLNVATEVLAEQKRRALK